MPELRRYRIFICHAWKRPTDEYGRFLKMLDAANNFIYSNYSVSADNPLPGNPQKGLEYRIQQSHVFIVLAGMYVEYRDMMKSEINYADNINKPILGVALRGSTNYPQTVDFAEIRRVGWNTDSVVTAIRVLAKT